MKLSEVSREKIITSLFQHDVIERDPVSEKLSYMSVWRVVDQHNLRIRYGVSISRIGEKGDGLEITSLSGNFTFHRIPNHYLLLNEEQLLLAQIKDGELSETAITFLREFRKTVDSDTLGVIRKEISEI